VRFWGSKSPEEKASDFAKNHERMTGEDFFEECELPESPEARRIAFAVRRSVALHGCVDADFIYLADRDPEGLIGLEGWDSLDFVGSMIQLEIELGEMVDGRILYNLPASVSVRGHPERSVV
jgi:hypothetical protein